MYSFIIVSPAPSCSYNTVLYTNGYSGTAAGYPCTATSWFLQFYPVYTLYPSIQGVFFQQQNFRYYTWSSKLRACARSATCFLYMKRCGQGRWGGGEGSPRTSPSASTQLPSSRPASSSSRDLPPANLKDPFIKQKYPENSSTKSLFLEILTIDSQRAHNLGTIAGHLTF